MADARVLVLVGSLRADSLNGRLAEVAVDTAPDGTTVEVFGRLGELPHYSEDVDVAPVADAVTALRAATAGADAVLAVTPEYNGSIPGALKNAIDWLSRPYGDGAITGKPVAVIGTSLGRFGGKWAHDETRKSFGIAGADVVEGVELSLASSVFDDGHPREKAEVVAGVRDVVARLVEVAG